MCLKVYYKFYYFFVYTCCPDCKHKETTTFTVCKQTTFDYYCFISTFIYCKNKKVTLLC